MTIREIKNWFELAIPNPTADNQRVQAGVHFEECAEMLETIHIESGDNISLKPAAAQTTVSSLADVLKKNKTIDLVITDRKELLDSLCDQIVTAVGVGHMYGFDIVGAINEVSRSNTSKFVDGKPVFNDAGKIAKGANYTPPNLEPFLGADPISYTSVLVYVERIINDYLFEIIDKQLIAELSKRFNLVGATYISHEIDQTGKFIVCVDINGKLFNVSVSNNIKYVQGSMDNNYLPNNLKLT